MAGQSNVAALVPAPARGRSVPILYHGGLRRSCDLVAPNYGPTAGWPGGPAGGGITAELHRKPDECMFQRLLGLAGRCEALVHAAEPKRV